MEKRFAPVGVFDSGMGGISVLKQLVQVLPEEDFLCFGDSENAPYGTKTKEEVTKLTMKHAKDLQERGIKALVVACNTATSAAITDLRKTYPQMPVIGIEPAIKPAALSKEHSHVLAMATPMTIREAKFHDLIGKYDEQAEIYPLAASGIVELVEQGMAESPEMDSYLSELFAPFREKNINAIVLGCTHFPFAREAIARYWGNGVEIFDGAEGTARELKRRLEEAGLVNEATHRGTVTIENSGGEKNVELAWKLLEGE